MVINEKNNMQKTFLEYDIRLPHLFDSDSAEKRMLVLRPLYHEIFTHYPDFEKLLLHISGCSEYLFESLRTKNVWLNAVLFHPVQSVLPAVYTDLAQSLDEKSAMIFDDKAAVLRIARQKATVFTALCDIAGIWDLKTVTHALSQTADTIISLTLRKLLAEEVARGALAEFGKPDTENSDSRDKNLGDSLDAPCEQLGYFVLAMGKLGAFELNYSSDVDVVIFFDQSNIPQDRVDYVRQVFIRMTRTLIRFLSEQTKHGRVYRVDLRLRPDPLSTQVCMSVEAAELYYSTYGRTWERSAWIKARYCAGSRKAAENFLAMMEQFIWRRYLDCMVTDEIADMLHKNFQSSRRGTGKGCNVKLGEGGIREIEFFVQTHQLIAGGRESVLRISATRDVLQVCFDTQWLKEEEYRYLDTAYVFFRTLEHRLQLINDQQVFVVPHSDIQKNDFAQIAAFMGYDCQEKFQKDFYQHRACVQKITACIFTPEKMGKTHASGDWEEQIQESSFPDKKLAISIINRWASGAIPATSILKVRNKLIGLIPEILKRFAQVQDPNIALIHFDQFISELPVGVQLVSLLEFRPKILSIIIEICEVAPQLAGYLAKNASVLDTVLYEDFFHPDLDPLVLLAQLKMQISKAGDYESELNCVRIWAREKNFQTSVLVLRGELSPEDASIAFSSVADACIQVLFSHVLKDVLQTTDTPPQTHISEPFVLPFVVIAFGKLGSRELMMQSDLDITFIYDDSPSQDVFYNSSFYANLARRLISALTVQTVEGALYQIDMRLRPSGRAGPIAVHVDTFAQYYQENKAWTWEYMALQKARVVAGDFALSERVSSIIADVLARKHSEVQVKTDVKEVHRKISENYSEIAEKKHLFRDIKWTSGGLMDIELIVRGLAMLVGCVPALGTQQALDAIEQSRLLILEDIQILRQAFALQYRLSHIVGITLEHGGLKPQVYGVAIQNLFAKITKSRDFDSLEETLATTRKAVRRIFHSVYSQ
jgi:glutamate-ammonia-ligase adenylyltransferase